MYLNQPISQPLSSNFDPIEGSVPFVLDKQGAKERYWDLWSRLLEDRLIFLGSPIDDRVANSISAQLLYLSAQSQTEDIRLYINSPGGMITAGLAIYDTMRMIPNDVQTVCLGQAASMGAVLLAAGTKGKRFCLPSASVMIHQPMGGASGQATDISIAAKRIDAMKTKLAEMLAGDTGNSIEKLILDMERDNWMNSREAVEYGLADEILNKKEKISE